MTSEQRTVEALKKLLSDLNKAVLLPPVDRNYQMSVVTLWPSYSAAKKALACAEGK